VTQEVFIQLALRRYICFFFIVSMMFVRILISKGFATTLKANSSKPKKQPKITQSN